MIAYDFDGHSRSLLYRIVTVIAALDNAPTDHAPASKDASFSYVHGPGIDDHRSRGRLGGDCHRQPAGRDERERASQLLCMTTTSGSVYYHHDGLGSTVALTDAAGAKIESYTYDVFGTVSIFDAAGFPQSSSTAGNRFLYTGREFVKEVNLYDYRNRVYSAELGRFLQTDPIRFEAGDVNLYRYVGNDPVNGVDPLGLAAGWNWLPGAAIKAAGMAAQKTLKACEKLQCRKDCIACCRAASAAGVISIQAAYVYSVISACGPAALVGGAPGGLCAIAMTAFKVAEIIDLGDSSKRCREACESKP
jgi:RHS repeat-associated protein